MDKMGKVANPDVAMGRLMLQTAVLIPNGVESRMKVLSTSINAFCDLQEARAMAAEVRKLNGPDANLRLCFQPRFIEL